MGIRPRVRGGGARVIEALAMCLVTALIVTAVAPAPASAGSVNTFAPQGPEDLVAHDQSALPASALGFAEAPVPSGLPAGVPAVALQPEPPLARPAGWPFPEAAPRTSGTWRLAAGAYYWTDFLFDDCGALGVSARVGTALCMGGYRYPSGPASGNGADLFRVGIGLDAEATYWRVDWLTLVDPNVPVAAFGLDTDGDPTTGASALAPWPANIGVRSAGVEEVLLVSSRGAWLLDPVTAARRSLSELGATLSVTPRAGQGYPGSFVLRIPRGVLEPSATWTVRLVAGLANAAGDGFASVGVTNGQAPGQPNVYNVGFRTVAQENEAQEQRAGGRGGSYWMEAAQAPALTLGDISGFLAQVDWRRLADLETTPEPAPRGWSTRWLVSKHSSGDGIGGLMPTFPGRLQTYGIWVPASYDPVVPAPVLHIHHSATQNHNQWFATPGTRQFLREACDGLDIICFTPNTRGGGATGAGELDWWETWADVARHYSLDPDRVYITGASLGGTSTRTLVAKYPDLFAGSMPLASSNTGACCGNLKWVPVWTGHETAISIFLPSNNNEMKALGYRFRDESYPAEEHFGYSASGKFMPGVGWLDIPRARRTGWQVPDIRYGFSPTAFNPTFSAERAAAYWLRDLVARTSSSARVEASTDALPGPMIETVITSDELVVSDDRPSPGIAEELVWNITGTRPASANRVQLQLTNIASATIVGAHAGLKGEEKLDLAVTSDGASRLRLELALPIGVLAAASPSGCASLAEVSTNGIVADLNAGSCTITIAALPDLAAGSLTVSAQRLRGGDEVTISAVANNLGGAEATDVVVRFFVDGVQLGGDQTIASLAAQASASVSSAVWSAKHQPGTHSVQMVLDPEGAIQELDKANNSISATFLVEGNKIRNGSFEESANGASPDAWTSSGENGYEDGGADGEYSVSTEPGGAWSSEPVAVTPGASYRVSVQASGAGGFVVVEQLAADGSLLGASSQGLPVSAGFEPASLSVTALAGATRVRVVLVGGLTGKATFDDVHVIEN